jgi:hypothetical protein
MRPVLVGIAPSREGSEGQPLSALGGASTGATLADLAGLSSMRYMQVFDRVNLVPFPRPSTVPLAESRPYAEMLAGSLLVGRRVVLLGRNVSGSFGIRDDFPLLTWVNWDRPGQGHMGFKSGKMSIPFSWAILPHPSGRNLWYNDPENRKLAGAFMTELAEGWEGAS